MFIMQSGDEDFPAPPPASDMLNMEFAPERSHTEVPIAPSNFNPVHIAVSTHIVYVVHEVHGVHRHCMSTMHSLIKELKYM